MPHKLSLTAAAHFSIREQANFIGNLGSDSALKFYDTLDAAFQRILELPQIGARRSFRGARLRDIRMWPIPDFPEYLIFYRSTDAGVEIIDVIHSAEDYRRVLGRTT